MNFTLAYCIENKDVALEFDHHLRMAGFTFDHISCDQVQEDESLERRINDPSKPVLLLVSDNFLKSPECMYRALYMIQSNLKTQHIQSIIIDGRQLEDGGTYKSVPTTFDRVSNVIQYMNHWQESYLDMRKIKRESNEENPEFDRRLKIVRSVSSEVGEFLRVLRSTDFWTYDQLIYNDYEIFFEALGRMDSHQSFKAKMKTATPTPVEEASISAPNIDLATIPGISLLEKDPTIDLAENKITSEPLPESKTVPVEISETVVEPSAPVSIVEEPATEIIPSKVIPETNLPIDPVPEEEINIPKKAFPANAKEVTPMVEIEEESVEIETPVEEYPESPPIPTNEKKEDPLLEKMIDYQKESMSEVEIVEEDDDETEELSQEEIERNLQALILESKSPGNGTQVSTLENEPPSQKESYEILQSIFDDEEEEELDNEDIDNETEEFDLSEEEEYNTIADLQKGQDIDNEEELIEEEKEPEANVASNQFIEQSNIDKSEEVIDFTDQTSGIHSFELNSKAALQKANILITGGEIERGLKIIENILEDEPYNTSLRYKYASYLAHPAKDYEEAIDQLEELILIDPKNVNAYILLAELAVEQNDFLLAKSYYEKALSMDDNRVDIYYRLGVILDSYFEEQRKKAGKYFRKVIKMDAHHVDAHYRYAIILTDLHDEDKKAIHHLEEVLLLDPRHPFANYDMALIFYKNKKRKKAARFCKKAYIINPELKTLANDQAFKYPKKTNDEEGPLPGTSQPNVMTDETLKFLAEEAAEEIRASKVEDIEISFASDLEFKPLKPKVVTTKTVLITGATSGIGRATAEEFALNGYRLILTGRRTTRLDTLKIYFEKRYESKVKILPFDVRDITSVQQAIDSLDEEWKEVDILINNAGLAKGFAPIFEGDIQDWEAMIDTNIKGLLYLTRVIAPQMVARKSGHIINIGSSAGKEVYPNGNVYCATKHAVEALTKAMRIELHQHNIRVSQVSPGHVEETEFAYVRFEDKERAKIYEDFQPLKAKDVAETIYFMVSRPSHVNIQDIVLFGTQQASNIFIDRTGRKD